MTQEVPETDPSPTNDEKPKYAWLPGMDNLSKFTRGDEETSRKVAIAALEWMDANPDKTPRFRGDVDATGAIAEEDNEDGLALAAAMKAAGGEKVNTQMMYTGVAIMRRVKHHGWEKFVESSKVKPITRERK